MHRFFVNDKQGNFFVLDKDILKHIKSARLENENILCNYKNEFYECKVENKFAKIIKKLDINNEYKNDVILAAPIIKIKRFEWILQKATELGANSIIPLNTKFVNQTIVKYDFEKKRDRFCEIIKNAAEQSFRNNIPKLTEIMTLEEVFDNYKNHIKYLAYENKSTSFQIKNLDTNSVLIVGPEGGFSDEEIQLASKNHCKIVNLGKTILRAETACLYMLSNVREK